MDSHGVWILKPARRDNVDISQSRPGEAQHEAEHGLD